MDSRKTRIVCTLGPATDSEENIKRLLLNGMNVARLNTSHGTIEEHFSRVEKLKKIRKELGLPLAILVDLEGPKIRTGKFIRDTVELIENNEFILTSRDILGDEKSVSVSYKELVRDLNKKDIILLNDGKIKLEVLSCDETDIKTKILVGGSITHRRGVNIPGVDIKLSALTDKDMLYLENSVKWEVDYIAQSFVRKSSDIMQTKEILAKLGAPDMPVIAKIETLQAINNLESILEVSDGVMVARGDLGVEVPVQSVPILQKKIINMANIKAKPVITATQMLETMIENPFPTRAEATDIANAILDGTDAVMLSAETSVGKYPFESVNVMVKVALETERYFGQFQNKINEQYIECGDKATNALSKSAVDISQTINAKVIVATTYSGYTARALSRFRKNITIIAASPREETYNRLALVWGVTPVIMSKFVDTDAMLEKVSNIVKSLGLGVRGDLILVTAGIPYGFSGATNLLKVHQIQ